jgi:hypothetical protein
MFDFDSVICLKFLLLWKFGARGSQLLKLYPMGNLRVERSVIQGGPIRNETRERLGEMPVNKNKKA